MWLYPHDPALFVVVAAGALFGMLLSALESVDTEFEDIVANLLKTLDQLCSPCPLLPFGTIFVEAYVVLCYYRPYHRDELFYIMIDFLFRRCLLNYFQLARTIVRKTVFRELFFLPCILLYKHIM